MNDLLEQPIESLAEFLAHAMELEIESAERYRDLADNMRVHNNPEVAELFERLAGYGDAHAEEVRQRAVDIELPGIPPWAFKWSCPETPEAPCMEDMHYLMSRQQALQLALHNEIRGRDFYLAVAQGASDAQLQTAAAEMAAEEDEHVLMLRAWIAREADAVEVTPEDLDPPNVPE